MQKDEQATSSGRGLAAYVSFCTNALHGHTMLDSQRGLSELSCREMHGCMLAYAWLVAAHDWAGMGLKPHGMRLKPRAHPIHVPVPKVGSGRPTSLIPARSSQFSLCISMLQKGLCTA